MAATTTTLRQRLKRETRSRIERAALRLLAKQGYDATSVEQIVQLAGTTRTTFYDHFRGKSDLIAVVQEREIAPALTALCERLDSVPRLDRRALRAWLDDYATVWQRIRVYFDAYSDASRTDPSVAETILPNSYAVTGRMTRFLACYEGRDRQVAHDQLILLFNELDQLMHVTGLMHDPADVARMLEAFTDVYWRGVFEPAMQRRESAARANSRRARPKATLDQEGSR